MALLVDAGVGGVVPITNPMVPIVASVSGATGTPRYFWRKITGPGVVKFGPELFHASHERGDFSEWEATQWGFQKGLHEGGGFISADRAYSGVYSWKGQNNPALPVPQNYSAKCLRWGFDGITELYASSWLWIPPEYDVIPGADNWVIVQQFKESVAPNGPLWHCTLHHDTGSGNDHIQLVNPIVPITYDNVAAVYPKGQWFHLIMYCKLHLTTGIISVWMDGAQIYHRINENTLGNNGSTHVHWGIGNYGTNQAAINYPVYHDDALVVNGVADRLNVTAVFSAPGKYVLRLTASDDVATVFDDAQFTVYPAIFNADPARPARHANIGGPFREGQPVVSGMEIVRMVSVAGAARWRLAVKVTAGGTLRVRYVRPGNLGTEYDLNQPGDVAIVANVPNKVEVSNHYGEELAIVRFTPSANGIISYFDLGQI